jgi:FixJ family two-component response regulator
MLPVIFVSGHGSVDSAVHAMRAGAVDFLQKPFDDQEVLDVIQRTLERDRRHRASLAEQDRIVERVKLLTPREREVMQRVVSGQANKVIAIELGVSERTVEIHRSRVMQKMEAESLPHLVRMALFVE